MFIPKYFELKDQKYILQIIKENPFATLVSLSSRENSEPIATQIPLLVDENLTVLKGHFAYANEQWKNIEGQSVLCIFAGAHSYISSSWYEEMPTVPTWNYLSVHVYGKWERVTDQDEIIQSLKDLISTYEEANSVYNFDQLEPEYIDKMIKAIIPFRIKIERIEAKAKLSQNHSKERREKVIRHLEYSNSENDQTIATWMRKFINR